jgi:hypothetical protein
VQRRHDAGQDQRHRPPPVPHQIAQAQHGPGDQRQGRAGLQEERAELRQHHGQDQHDRAEGGQHQDRRIDERRAHLVAHRLAALQVLSQPRQRRLQRPAGLAGADHRDGDRREQLALGRHGVRQTGAAAQAPQQLRRHLRPPPRAAGQQRQRLLDRDAGADQRAELLDQIGESAAGQALAAEEVAGKEGGAGTGIDGLGGQRDVAEGLETGDGRGTVRSHEHSREGLACRGYSTITKAAHY